MKFIIRPEDHPCADEVELPQRKFFDSNHPEEVEDAYADAKYRLELFDRYCKEFQFVDE